MVPPRPDAGESCAEVLLGGAAEWGYEARQLERVAVEPTVTPTWTLILSSTPAPRRSLGGRHRSTTVYATAIGPGQLRDPDVIRWFFGRRRRREHRGRAWRSGRSPIPPLHLRRVVPSGQFSTFLTACVGKLRFYILQHLPATVWIPRFPGGSESAGAGTFGAGTGTR